MSMMRDVQHCRSWGSASLFACQSIEGGLGRCLWVFPLYLPLLKESRATLAGREWDLNLLNEMRQDVFCGGLFQLLLPTLEVLIIPMNFCTPAESARVERPRCVAGHIS